MSNRALKVFYILIIVWNNLVVPPGLIQVLSCYVKSKTPTYAVSILALISFRNWDSTQD